jgi:hypothetical protein
MTSKNQLTYLFGAGASFKSMPIVNNFTDRYEAYLNFLTNGINVDSKFLHENRNFITEVKSHLSFDTFFKKLFHQDQSELTIKYKYFLLLFFVYEHIADVHAIRGFTHVDNVEKNYCLDPRYDALIAGLLRPTRGKCDFYCDITFMTWNYDNNLLFSLFNFLEKNISFNSFLEKSYSGDNIFKISPQIKVIHLNGFIKNENIISLGTQDITSLAKIFYHLILQYPNQETITGLVSTLKFAWESLTSSDKLPVFIDEAISEIKKSGQIIITGYSFPLYNRIFDQSIFTAENLSKSVVYIRDPHAAELKSLFHTAFKIKNFDNSNLTKSDYPTYIVPSVSCESFFIPPMIYQ